MPLKLDRVRAITLDLDDTLWPVMPVIARAEAALQAWLAVHAPRVAQHFDAPALRAVREGVSREFPHWAHDLTAQRLETIRRLLMGAGEDEALAAPAFEVFFAERQKVDLYADVPEALDALARRWPLLALSNGNADVARVGLGGWFRHSVSARDVGAAKPDRRIFEAACSRLGLEAGEVLHVGDDLHMDVLGAGAAGMQTAWVRRPQNAGTIGDEHGAAADWHGPDLGALVLALESAPDA